MTTISEIYQECKTITSKYPNIIIGIKYGQKGCNLKYLKTELVRMHELEYIEKKPMHHMMEFPTDILDIIYDYKKDLETYCEIENYTECRECIRNRENGYRLLPCKHFKRVFYKLGVLYGRSFTDTELLKIKRLFFDYEKTSKKFYRLPEMIEFFIENDITVPYDIKRLLWINRFFWSWTFEKKCYEMGMSIQVLVYIIFAVQASKIGKLRPRTFDINDIIRISKTV